MLSHCSFFVKNESFLKLKWDICQLDITVWEETVWNTQCKSTIIIKWKKDLEKMTTFSTKISYITLIFSYETFLLPRDNERLVPRPTDTPVTGHKLMVKPAHLHDNTKMLWSLRSWIFSDQKKGVTDKQRTIHSFTLLFSSFIVSLSSYYKWMKWTDFLLMTHNLLHRLRPANKLP